MLFNMYKIFLMLIIIRPQDFIIDIKGMPLVFVTMITLIALWLADKGDKQIETNIDKFFVYFFIVIFISGLMTLNIAYAIDNTVDDIKMTLVYCCSVTIMNSDSKISLSIKLLVLLISTVALTAVLQHFGYDLTGIGMYWANDKQVWQIRGVGIFDNPNDLAYSVLPAMAFSCSYLIFDKRIYVKMWSLFVALLSTYCIILTNSRGGFLALVTLLVVIMNFAVSSRVFKKFVLVTSLCCLVVVFSSKTKDYRSDGSSMGRVEAWSAGMTMFIHNPIFGVGKGMFLDNHSRDSHSSYVRAGAELGFVGFYVFIGILYWCTRSLKVMCSLADLERYKPCAVALLAYMSAYSVASLFSTRTYDVLFFIMAAVASALIRNIKSFQNKSVIKMLVVEKMWNTEILLLSVSSFVIWKLFLVLT